ncbi:lipid-A-disaccharide synthase [Aestuariibius sp. HNIBRBA575]|uniref:lipid-A-disaccharide synthase n=1 Tax=Aestuariibius sp. HNIBRBA575 TaxID=3233343 RepID=UPI0034A55D6B
MNVFIIAGEASGDKLGAALMDGLSELRPNVVFNGIGGQMMTQRGLTSQFEMSELSVMGIAEVLPKYFHLKRRIRETADAILAQKPDVVVTIDSPDFCLRVAKLVKPVSDIRIVHYVAPSVWAWRPKRADKMAALVDQVLALLPFEPPYMLAAGVRCDFVGHPVTTETVADAIAVTAFKAKHGLGEATLIALPGSRRGEVGRLSERFGQAIAEFGRDHPDLQVILPVAPGLEDLVRQQVADWPVKPILLTGTFDKSAAFQSARIALAASGTVSLELAAAGTPMVIAYDMNWLSRRLIKRMLRIDTVTLVNLVANSRTVPEFIGDKCLPDDIANALTKLWDHPDAQNDAMQITMEKLGRGAEKPGLRAARAVLDGLELSV